MGAAVGITSAGNKASQSFQSFQNIEEAKANAFAEDQLKALRERAHAEPDCKVTNLLLDTTKEVDSFMPIPRTLGLFWEDILSLSRRPTHPYDVAENIPNDRVVNVPDNRALDILEKQIREKPPLVDPNLNYGVYTPPMETPFNITNEIHKWVIGKIERGEW
jgi:hypothetical protein